MVHKPIEFTPWTAFQEVALPFYFNRVSEAFHLQQHQHDFMELAYVAEGGGFHYINDQIIPVSKGDWFILPLGVSHVFRPTGVRPSHPLIVYNCIFQAEALASELASIPGASALQHALRILQLSPDIEPLWQQLRDPDGRYGEWFRLAQLEYQQRKPGFVARLYSMFIELAVMLERQKDSTARPDAAAMFASEADPFHFEAIIAQINHSFTEPLQVKEMAAAQQMSERHFHRLFKQHTGMTFIAYIQRKRIEKSCELLTFTRMPIQEIAVEAGYQDKKFFLALFKKITGLTPREYRRVNTKLIYEDLTHENDTTNK